jgi:sugar lactone lactonase YvrE
VVAIAGLSAGRANAASVFIWVADGSTVTGYGSNGAAVSGATLTAPGGGDYFALATAGTSGNNEDLYVADSGLHQLSEWSWNGSSLSQVGSTVAFAPDPSGGNVSPQEIAVDGSGNLWTTSVDGQIVEYSSSLGTPTTVYPSGSVLAAARGIMIDGTTAYVTVDGAYGSGSVYTFSTTSPGTPALYASVSGTTGGQADGQMRGVAVDTDGNIFYADSTWGASGTDKGYIKENTGSSSVISGLNGPNELETGAGTAANGHDSANCDVLYVANYYGGSIQEYNTGYTIGGNPTCGSSEQFETVTTLVTGLTDPSGLALSPGESSLGGDSVTNGPTFISDPVSATPEPGTFALMIGALLLALGIGIRAQRRQLQ